MGAHAIVPLVLALVLARVAFASVPIHREPGDTPQLDRFESTLRRLPSLIDAFDTMGRRLLRVRLIVIVIVAVVVDAVGQQRLLQFSLQP